MPPKAPGSRSLPEPRHSEPRARRGRGRRVLPVGNREKTKLRGAISWKFAVVTSPEGSAISSARCRRCDIVGGGDGTGPGSDRTPHTSRSSAAPRPAHHVLSRRCHRGGRRDRSGSRRDRGNPGGHRCPGLYRDRHRRRVGGCQHDVDSCHRQRGRSGRGHHRGRAAVHRGRRIPHSRAGCCDSHCGRHRGCHRGCRVLMSCDPPPHAHRDARWCLP